MKNQGSVDINRPIGEVFRLTNEKVAEWSLVVVEDTLIEEKPGMVGSTFINVTEDKGQRIEFKGVITKWDEPYLSQVDLTGKMFDILATYSFEEIPDGTRVTQQATVTGHGFFKVMIFFMIILGAIGRLFGRKCDALNKEFASLKAYCENYPTTETEAEPVA